MTKVLVAIPRVHEATRAGLKRLQDAGCELVLNPHGRTLREDELIAMLPGCFATIAGGERYSERVFAAAPESFALVVTDHAMPQMTGIELAERLRARLPTLRWLLCTGFADEASVARARALGALAVLHKPVEPVELRTAIESALQTADDQLVEE